MTTSSPLALSPSFERARIWSNVLRCFFIVNFWVTALWLAGVLLVLIWPEAAKYNPDNSLLSVSSLAMPERIKAVAADVARTLPALILLYYAIKIFGCFARGEVFAPVPIAHIRAAGLWTVIWGFAPTAARIILDHHVTVKFEPALVAFGIATFIAAHVVGEAQRIADENASIL